MLIGITYDLKSEYLNMGYSEEHVAEFDTEETIEGMDNALKSLGYQTDRIGNVKNLIERLNNGKRWDLIFNICEGFYGTGREAQVPAVLDIYNIPYTFSDVCIMSLTLNKALTKHIVMNAGFKTAPFNVINTIEDAYNIEMMYPLFIKPVYEGTGKGIDKKSLVNNKSELISSCSEKIQKKFNPLLVEKYLSGREFTVGILGTASNSKVIGVIEVNYNNEMGEKIYSYQTKTDYEKLVNYSIPEAEIINLCSEMALGIWNLLGCCDAGRIDVRMDENNILNFIEINPLAGLNYKHSDLPIMCKLNGITFNELIKEIIDSARSRYQI